MKPTELTARSVRAFTLVTTAGATLALMLSTTSATLDAHKAKTSPFTYNKEIFPILRDKCSSCHVDSGPAPMSLMTYDTNGGAVAWAESIREMLLAGAMPPWYADPTGPAVRNSHGLTSRELDEVITWATGGTPHGDLTKQLATVAFKNDWAQGKPDIELPMPEPFTVPANTVQASTDVTIPTGFTEAKWVKAVDLRPGVPSMVRRAYVTVDDGPLLALWEPGGDVVTPPSGVAFRIATGAKLHVKLDYKKSWQDEQKPLSDKSVVGLYLTDPPLSGKSITSVVIDGTAGQGSSAPRTFGGSVPVAGRVVAVTPILDDVYETVSVTAVTASGGKTPLLKLRNPRPEWARRYWLADPVELPANSRIEVATTPGDPDVGPLGQQEKFPLRISLEVVPQ
jgi:hypothetical protein